MSDTHDFSAISHVTGGDEHAARRLKATIAVIMRRTEDPELRALGKEVLAGRENVRRFLTHPSLMGMAERNFNNLEAGLERLVRRGARGRHVAGGRGADPGRGPRRAA